MYRKSVPLILTIVLLTGVSISALDFRTENPINFYSSLNADNNDIYNLTSIINDGTKNLEFENSGKVTLPQGELELQNGGLTITDQLKLTQNGEIRVDGSNDDLSLDIGSGGRLAIRDSNENIILKAGENGKVKINQNNLNLSSNRITNLAEPQLGSDAATFEWTDSNFISRSGDTLNGTLDFNGNSIEDVQFVNLSSGLSIDGDINTSGGNITTEGGNIALEGGYLSNDGDDEGISVDNDGNVDVPEGNLDLNANYINDVWGLDFNDTSGDGTTYQITEANSGKLRITSSSTNALIEISENNGELDVLNGNVDTNGNNITSSNGRMCIGENC